MTFFKCHKINKAPLDTYKKSQVNNCNVQATWNKNNLVKKFQHSLKVEDLLPTSKIFLSSSILS